jgi:CRP/FNR family transcriptional regulator
MPSLAVLRTHDRPAVAIRPVAPARPADAVADACSACASHRFCLPLDTDGRLHELVAQRVRVRKGDVLVHGGEPFRNLYTVRLGSCKSVVTTPGGQEQLAGYHISGDLVGSEAIFGGRHDATVTALEDSEFCVIPMERLEAVARTDAGLQHAIHALMSREIGRERKVMLMLGAMRAEQRLATFLLDLAERYAARGYSSSAFVLRMTREEIGCHLGLKLETVSRLFSRFHRERLIRVDGREVQILDRAALERVVDASLH